MACNNVMDDDINNTMPKNDDIREDDDDYDDGDCVEVNDVGQDRLKIKGKRKREKKHTKDGLKKVKCKWCGDIKNYDSKHGTGNLKRHLDKRSRKDVPDVGQMILGRNKDSLKLKSTKFNPDVFREKLVGAIVMHNLPLSFVEYSGIKSLFEYVSEDLNLICRNTVRSDILKMHKREKTKMQLLLKEAPGRICLPSDLWTSITTDGYISLTAHFVDKNWILQKRLLNFADMPPPHNGISLSEKVYAMLADWEIEGQNILHLTYISLRF